MHFPMRKEQLNCVNHKMGKSEIRLGTMKDTTRRVTRAPNPTYGMGAGGRFMTHLTVSALSAHITGK